MFKAIILLRLSYIRNGFETISSKLTALIRRQVWRTQGFTHTHVCVQTYVCTSACV